MATQSVTGLTSHRLAAFCDGVVVIAITLLVWENQVPNLERSDADALKSALIPSNNSSPQ
jgi:uncharacterized membrane protein